MDVGRRTFFATLLLGAAPVQAAKVHGGTLRVNGRALRFREAGRRNASPLLVPRLRSDADLRGLAADWRVFAIDLGRGHPANTDSAVELLRAADMLALGRISLLVKAAELPIAREVGRRAPGRLDRVFVETEDNPQTLRGVGPVRWT